MVNSLFHMSKTLVLRKRRRKKFREEISYIIIQQLSWDWKYDLSSIIKNRIRSWPALETCKVDLSKGNKNRHRRR